MATERILVVEDDDDIRAMVARALKIEGYSVLLAGNGQEALDLLSSTPEGEWPCGILLDLMMPVMDGETFLVRWSEALASRARGVNESARASCPKVIITTAKGHPLPEAVVSRSVATLRKPVDLERLYSTLEKHCRSLGADGMVTEPSR